MRYSIILDGLGLILIVFSMSFLGPIWAGVWYDEDPYLMFKAYGIPIIICLSLGFGLRALMHERYEQVRASEALVMVSMSWLVLAAIGSIPYLAVGVVHDAAGAFFESMSGFTTTGATVLSGLDSMPKSILLWRSLTEWLGGMGVIVLSVAILSRFFGGGGKSMFMQAEVPGGRVTRMAPRMAQTARLLWGIYVLFTVLMVGALLAVGQIGDVKMGTFDAICHALTCLPTGGFGTHDASMAHWDNPAVELVATLFMLVAGTSFVLHYNALRGRWRDYLKDPEFRFAMLVIVLAVVFVTGDLAVRGVYGVGQSFRYGSFHVVSIVTTTGYATDNFGAWPLSSQIVILLLMLFGGTIGSTGGGIKMLRMLVVLKSVRLLFARATHRRGVFHVRVGDVVLPDSQVASTGAYVVLYLMIAAVGALLVSLDGTDLVTSTSASVTAISNVGPGLGAVGPATTFAGINGFSKVVLSLLMWLGRLEILGCLLLFNPKALRE